MKEQIAKLANESGFNVSDFSEMNKVDKLTELIVQSCANVIGNDYSIRTGVDYYTKIKKYFGVE